jgi:hypothetical protein
MTGICAVDMERYSMKTQSDERAPSTSRDDRAFCVFDGDGHQNYDAAVAKVTQCTEGQA